jgi:ketosteroid isomerase-like protein
VNPKLLIALVLLLPAAPQDRPLTEMDLIRQLIANYAAAVDAFDVRLAGQVSVKSPDVSFIHPLGQAHGWEEVKAFFTAIMDGMFSEPKLTPRDIRVHVYRETALTPRGLISARSGATTSRSLTLIDQVALGGGGGLAIAKRRAVLFRERPWRQELALSPLQKVYSVATS